MREQSASASMPTGLPEFAYSGITMTIMHITRTAATFSPRIVAADDIAPITPLLRLVGKKPKLSLVKGGGQSWKVGKK